VTDLEARVEIVLRRVRFERDPAAFAAEFEPQQSQLRRRILMARRTLRDVVVDRALLIQIAGLCHQAGADGHRGELAVMRSAKALAAFEDRESVNAADVRRVAPMSLRHRLRKDVLADVDAGARIRQALERVCAPASPATTFGNGVYRTASAAITWEPSS
jgi:magnesium chelatase subunit I